MKNLYLEKILRSPGENNAGTNPESTIPTTPPTAENTASNPTTPRDQIVPLRPSNAPVPGAPDITGGRIANPKRGVGQGG